MKQIMKRMKLTLVRPDDPAALILHLSSMQSLQSPLFWHTL